jgi:thiol-disulfide isomerase/thioredoxin
MKKLLTLSLFAPMIALSQTGIKFEHTSWKDIQAKARAEKKYIFIDAFTTWCGPCKYMASTIFPQQSVGKFFNEKFINVKVQLDTTAEDAAEIKSWYKDAHDIKVNSNINVYPTYLFFDPNGKLVHRATGSTNKPEEFIVTGEKALNPEKQYYVLLDKYKAGKKDPEFLRQLSLTALAAYDLKQSQALTNEYLAMIKDPFTKETFQLIDQTVLSTKDKGFKLLFRNTDKFDKVVGKGSSSKKIVDLVLEDEVYPIVFRDEKKAPDWALIKKRTTAAYPLQANEIITSGKVTYYQSKNDWLNFQSAIVNYMKKYGSNVKEEELNAYAWSVFENCSDMTCVKEALAWSKKSFAENNDPMYIDTYANILYKMGKKKEAIEWETKALALASPSDKEVYQQTLGKMKKGAKTWKN